MTRKILALPIALTISFGWLTAVATPATAGPRVDCAVEAASLRNSAAALDARTASRVLREVSMAEKLCAEQNSFEAARKFAGARKLAGVDAAQQLAEDRTQPEAR